MNAIHIPHLPEALAPQMDAIGCVLNAARVVKPTVCFHPLDEFLFQMEFLAPNGELKYASMAFHSAYPLDALLSHAVEELDILLQKARL